MLGGMESRLREWLWFVASLAAACVLTAIQVMYPPTSPIWKYVLWGGIIVLFLTSLVLIVDLLRNKTAKKQVNKNGALRIPLLKLRDIAETKGWDFENMPKLNAMEFMKELRQAGLDGSLMFFGRHKKYDVEKLNLKEPLQEIERSHWKDYSITGLIHPQPGHRDLEENMYVESYIMDASVKGGRFMDLHVDKPTALKWLKKITKQYEDA
jgi:hypothetical protein